MLVDFWTYSCINCQRTLPHVEAWYQEYAKDGFVVVGVHTPEFAFEHVVSNVRAQAAALGVHYPVAIDNDYATWNAYDNEYWPADYLIDAQRQRAARPLRRGRLRRHRAADPPAARRRPPRACRSRRATDVPNQTPTGEMSPETYVGYERLQYLVPGHDVTRDAPAAYHFPASLPLGGMGLSGTWTDHAQEATAGPAPELELGFLAQEVYLVLGGTGTLEVTVNGRPRPDHRRPRRAPALHPVPGGASATGEAAAARLARRPGLRLHVRLIAGGTPLVPAGVSRRLIKRSH